MYQMLSYCWQQASYLISRFIAYCSRAWTVLVRKNKSATCRAALASDVESHYRLDNDTSATLVLPDGRKLGYAQYGSSTGRVIFFLHGTPGSRKEAALFDELGITLGARIIAPERPGFGWSSPHPNRTILDHVKDVEYLAKHLGVEEYGVLGISGGGPYGLACAASMPPDKLKAVAIVCGLGPPDIGYSDMDWNHWLGFTIGYRYFPGLCRWWWKRDVGAQLDLTDDKRLELSKLQFANSSPHEKDVEVMRDDGLHRLFVRGSREYFAQGFDGVLQDGRLICEPFGFRVEDIRSDLPVQLWYGKLDTSVPAVFGQQIAVRLGGRAELRVEDETHLSITMNWREQILENLVRSM